MSLQRNMSFCRYYAFYNGCFNDVELTVSSETLAQFTRVIHIDSLSHAGLTSTLAEFSTKHYITVI